MPKRQLTTKGWLSLLACLRKHEAKQVARNHRHAGMRGHERTSQQKKEGLFSHLPPLQQTRAREIYARYLQKHASKLARLEGWARTRYLGCLAGAASRWACRKTNLTPEQRVTYRRVTYYKGLRTKLGLREKRPKVPWNMHLAKVGKEHARHGEAYVAPTGSTNMEGV